MIKKIAWEAFKNTGDINAYMEFKQIENLEKQIDEEQQNWSKEENVEEQQKNKWDNQNLK